MDIYTPYRVASNILKGFFNFISLIDKNKTNKTIFVDVTEVHIKDTKSGVQRVTNEILKYLKLDSKEFEIQEVYALPHEGGFYLCSNDKPMKIGKQDIFFGLDLSKFILHQNIKHLKKMFNNNIPVYFFLHDLMPITIPEYCSESVIKIFPRWVKTVIQFTGVISNSKATMDELENWLKDNPSIKRNPELELSYVHLGCDFDSSKIIKTEKKNNDSINFLMVSTVEPRKKYDLAVKSFNLLWEKGYNITLSIVGKKGWNNENTFKLIEESKYLNDKLFWYNSGISDEKLSELYIKSNAVLVTSIAEGFGLCLAEAAFYNVPVIVRDLPVFREIAEDNAFYFNTDNPEHLAESIENWLELYKTNNHPKPFTNFTTWKECSKEVYNIITKDR